MILKRKDFLATSALSALASLAPFAQVKASNRSETSRITVPPYLKPGDLIGITAPAGHITREEILPAATKIQEWGFKIRVGYTIGKKDFTYGGTDEERLQDFQLMLDDPQIKAILCARGGYGSVRIIDQLDWRKFKAHPKWIIGFSDITVFHSHIHAQLGIATIHSKMCNSFPTVWENAEPLQKETIISLQKALTGEKMSYTAAAVRVNQQGMGKGSLVGGNLKTLESLSGSSSDICTDGKILFVEDTGEYLYSIDRMFWNLKRSGKLEKLAGLIVGGIKVKQDAPDEYFGKEVYDIVSEKTKRYPYPVAFDFPVGHQINNFAYKCGGMHRLEVTDEGSRLYEI